MRTALLIVFLLLFSPGISAEDGTPPSRFGKLTSRRWAYGMPYQRENLKPVTNPNPCPEPQPRRDHPFDVAVSPDGEKVYVALQGSELEPGCEVAVLGFPQGEVLRRISLRPPTESGPSGSSPYRFAWHPGGRFLVVTNRFSNFASVIDSRLDQVVCEIPLDFYCQGVTFDAQGRRAYVANRYLDQVLVLEVEVEGDRFTAAVREQGGLEAEVFLEDLHPALVRRCGTSGCHDTARGGFVAGSDPRESFFSALSHLRPGRSAESRLVQAPLGSEHGGYADRKPNFRGHAGGVVFTGLDDPDLQALLRWVDGAGEGPGIPVGNFRSKPKLSALSTDGRYLFVGNTGTQDISIVDTRTLREVGGIYLQNVVNDLLVVRDDKAGEDYLLVTTEGVGFGVVGERDPWGGESWDPTNQAAHYSLWRDLGTGQVLPRSEQVVLGPFDAVDGTAAIKFRDIQNDLVVIRLSGLDIPDNPEELAYLLRADRYEAHQDWVRYTSDTAESTYGDIKGDIPPELMRVQGAFPEKMTRLGNLLCVTMQASNEVQLWRLNLGAADPTDWLLPLGTVPTGFQPIGIAAGPEGTPAEGLAFVVNFLGGSVSVIDPATATSKEFQVDPSLARAPVPATNAERGEFIVHSALFSSDGDTSCFHCHYLDLGDGRPWGVSQVVGQEYLHPSESVGQLTIGGTMGVPQMRGLFAIQPFFFEGVLSAFEPRSMLMEHAPADDFAAETPQGDYTGLVAHYQLKGTADLQSRMKADVGLEASLEERRDAMFRDVSMNHFGKAFTLRDFQRFVGEWQIHESRLLPNPYDQRARSVLRGKAVFEGPQVGCVACHPPPHFAKKDFPDNPTQAFEPTVLLTARDAAFTLISMNRLDAINGYTRDLEPDDEGRVERVQGHFTTFPLRGLWDRPPVFLHNGMARTLHEVVAPPGHPGLRRFKYEPLLGGCPERPGRREVGFNATRLFTESSARVRAHQEAGARLGVDTHGGTLHLKGGQLDDLVDFLNSIE